MKTGIMLAFVCAGAMAAPLGGCATADGGAQADMRRAHALGCSLPTDMTQQSVAANAGLEPKRLRECAPRYPEKCMASAKQEEVVQLVYDVSPDGVPENIRVAETTNRCLNRAAIQALARWRYEADGKGAKDMTTHMTMRLWPASG